ncbi:MAG: pimeloyl-ACP methyl ester carboxylesterase [Moritella sp.]
MFRYLHTGANNMIRNKLKLFSVFFCVFLLTGCELVRWKIDNDEGSLKDAGFAQHGLSLNEGGTINYWRGGQGEPLLLIHGFGGSAISTWKAEMLALSKDYQIIAPDLAWFGDSFSAGEANLTTETDAIWQLLDHLQISRTNVAGISYGGFITFNMMNKPERINKAVIIASPGPYFSDQDLAELNQRFAVDAAEDFFVPKNQQELRRLFDGIFVEPKMMPDFIADQIYQTYFATWHKQKIAMIQSLPADRDILLQQSTKDLPPTMLIWGEQDRIFPLANGIELSKKMSAPIVVLPNTAHGVTNEKPEAVVNLIKTFIN